MRLLLRLRLNESVNMRFHPDVLDPAERMTVIDGGSIHGGYSVRCVSLSWGGGQKSFCYFLRNVKSERITQSRSAGNLFEITMLLPANEICKMNVEQNKLCQKSIELLKGHSTSLRVHASPYGAHLLSCENCLMSSVVLEERSKV